MSVFKAYGAAESILKNFIRRYVSGAHDIEDICQETVTRALEAERSRRIDDPGAFLFGVARNVVRKRLDKQSRSLIDFVSDFGSKEQESEDPSLEESLDRDQQLVLFMEAIATLPPQCQRVFVMKKVYGYKHKEIAAKLDISISTVEKHAAAGFKRCLEALDKLQAAKTGNKVDAVVQRAKTGSNKLNK